MKIAVPYEDGSVFQHFGHAGCFKIYNVEDGRVTGSELAPTDGSGHGALAGFLKDRGASALICGGIGGGAVDALTNAGIKVCAGVSGSADEAAKAYAEGTLAYSGQSNCDHHGHGCGGHDNCEHGGCV